MKNQELNDFQEKFQMFQECVLAWLSELDADLLRVKASLKESGPMVKRNANVIAFPRPRGVNQPEKPVA